ncbi:hypothetical protein Vretimale_10944 [Volvox reticuliferus]|uniref:Cyclin-like domain-containing protein n=1 Tax=Volvox reticuliferus TaxID=1737510 RepID=A0A8J4CLE1_9CHLO|nr:hypothetical protein Vretifemale_12660 [Volvox reticuliferus]GIM06708.1 hypothetical protein Vretimale_10944 [Volvox reticuliferus]
MAFYLGEICQHGAAYSSRSSGSLACSMEDEYCLSSSTDALECSEDMSCDAEQNSDDACDELNGEQIAGSAHLCGSINRDVDVHLGTLIRADLGSQQEIYASDKQVLYRAIYAVPQSISCELPYASASEATQVTDTRVKQADCAATLAERVYSGWPESSLVERRLLVAWMLELTGAAQLQRETLFLATSLLDRFMAASVGSTFEPPERLLQLLAMACVSIAMKFEEVVPLHSADLVRLAIDHETGAPLYQISDLGQMEWRLLWMVNWRARAPTSLSFLQYFLHCCGGTFFPYDMMGWTALCPADGVSTRAATGKPPVGRTSKGGVRRKKGGVPAAVSILPDGVETWAHRILDAALLHHCDLVHCQSTVALASLVLAERTVVAAAAAAGVANPRPPRPSRPVPYLSVSAIPIVLRGPCMRAVQTGTGLSIDELAPNLEPCLALLERVWVMEQQQHGLAQPQVVPLQPPSPPYRQLQRSQPVSGCALEQP